MDWAMLRAGLIAAFVAGIKVALAQSPQPDQSAIFSAYISSAVYKTYPETALRRGEPPALRSECPALRLLEANKVQILDKPKLVQAGKNFNIDSGARVAVANMDRCGQRVN
jgi:hypothetical protein